MDGFVFKLLPRPSRKQGIVITPGLEMPRLEGF
jgi:hypothetical protein